MERWSKEFFITALTIALVGLQMLINAPTTLAQQFPVAKQSATHNQSGIPDWNTLSVDERRAMLSRLSDEQVRNMVAGQLDRSAREEKAAGRNTADDGTMMIGGFEAKAHIIRENLGKLLARIGDLPSALTLVYKNFTKGRSPWHVFYVLAGMTVMFTVGYIAERLFRRWTSHGQRLLRFRASFRCL